MAHRPTRQALTILAALTLAVTTAGCAEKIDNGGDSQAGDEITPVNPGKLTTCTHLPYEPFQFRENGETVGFDVDLIDLVAEDLGLQQKIFNTPFEGIKSGESLNIGDCDVAAAAMTITPTREEVMDFSRPYFNATQSLLVPQNSGITGLGDMSGKKLGVQQATTGQKYAEEHKSEFGYKPVVFEDLALMQQAVSTGKVAAAINDDEPNRGYAKDHPGVSVTKEFETGEQYGFAVKKGNGALLAKINEVLDQAVADGTYADIYRKWFDEKPPEEFTQQ